MPMKKRKIFNTSIKVLFLCILSITFVTFFYKSEYNYSLALGQDFSFTVTIYKLVSSISLTLLNIFMVNFLIELSRGEGKDNVKPNDELKDFIANEIQKSHKFDYKNLSDVELNKQLDILVTEYINKGRMSHGINIPFTINNISEYNLGLIYRVLDDCIKGEYYEDYSTNIQIKIIDDEWIKMTTTTSYCVHNATDNNFHFRAMYPTIETFKSLNFEKVKIYSSDRKKELSNITEEVNKSIQLVEIRSKQEHHNVYKANANASFANLKLNDYYIEFTRCYVKKKQNGVFVHSIPKPTKYFNAEIFLDGDSNNQYKLYGISFFPYKQVDEQMSEKMLEKMNGPHNIIIRNNNWCVPGSGISFTLMRNLDTELDNQRYAEFLQTGKLKI